ncbi:MAG: hypothetical protein NZ580_07255 [Bacteroidia bacterium]|nr:hypothetical protein [Bacteroidia bacterium]
MPRIMKLDLQELYKRSDPNFWNPRWHEEAYEVIMGGKSPFPIRQVGEFLREGTEGLTYGSTATGEGREILGD